MCNKAMLRIDGDIESGVNYEFESDENNYVDTQCMLAE